MLYDRCTWMYEWSRRSMWSVWLHTVPYGHFPNTLSTPATASHAIHLIVAKPQLPVPAHRTEVESYAIPRLTGDQFWQYENCSALVRSILWAEYMYSILFVRLQIIELRHIWFVSGLFYVFFSWLEGDFANEDSITVFRRKSSILRYFHHIRDE